MANTLNEAGDIAGWHSLAGNDHIRHATLWSAGHITDLGALGPDACSVPRGINSRKQVVGFVSLDCSFDDSSLRAFLWEPGGQMIDLNSSTSPSLGIQLLNAATINDRGEMAVVADFADGNRRPVLLIPCDAQQGDSEDCQDSAGLKTTLSMQVTGTVAPAASRNNRNAETLSAGPRALLSRR